MFKTTIHMVPKDGEDFFGLVPDFDDVAEFMTTVYP